jgi:hypothetical protein
MKDTNLALTGRVPFSSHFLISGHVHQACSGERHTEKKSTLPSHGTAAFGFHVVSATFFFETEESATSAQWHRGATPPPDVSKHYYYNSALTKGASQFPNGSGDRTWRFPVDMHCPVDILRPGDRTWRKATTAAPIRLPCWKLGFFFNFNLFNLIF